MALGDDIVRIMIDRGITRVVGEAYGEGDSAQDSSVSYLTPEQEKEWLDKGNTFDPEEYWDRKISGDWNFTYSTPLDHGDALGDAVDEYMMRHQAFCVDNEGSRLYFSADLTQEVPIRVIVEYPETTWDVGYNSRE